MQKLSVVISAFNEEKKIEDCFRSVSFADEIIFVDNSSTDNTAKIAKKYTSKIFTRENNLMLNVNKNFGFTKAEGDWILNLDADERITLELEKEILRTIQSSADNIDGYWIPRKNIIFGKWIESSLWSPDFQLRLFRKGKGKFPEKHVHEYVEVKGETFKLSNPMTHINYTSVSQYIEKMNTIYTENEVENWLKSGKSISWVDAIRFPVNDFVKTFFAQSGYKDGLHGLVLSMLQAFYAEIVFAKIWEKKGFYEEYPSTNSLKKEIEKNILTVKYWMYSMLFDETKNKFKKITYRLLRKQIKRKLDSQ